MGNIFKSLFSSPKTNEEPDSSPKADEKNFDLFKYDGIRAQRIGKIQYAIKCYEEALLLKADLETMVYLVSAYIAAHEFESALETTARMLELEPENIGNHLSRINVLFLLDRETDVIEAARKIIELDPAHPAAWYMMGKAKKSLADYAGAIDDLSESIRLKPDFPDAYLLRAETYLKENRADDALADIEVLETLVPEEEHVYLLKGQAYENKGDLSTAAELYRQVLDLNPYNEESALLYASLLVKEGKPGEAVEHLDEIIELKPDFAAAYHQRADAKALKGDAEGAEADRRQALELAPESPAPEKQANFDDLYKGGIF